MKTSFASKEEAEHEYEGRSQQRLRQEPLGKDDWEENYD